MPSPPDHPPEHHGGASRTEWVLAALSALIVLGTVGALFYEALADPPTPPDIHVTATGSRPAGPGYLVEFEAENRGQTTAARVEIEGTVGAETASATIDYLPAKGRRRGGLYFSADPRADSVSLDATGYARP